MALLFFLHLLILLHVILASVRLTATCSSRRMALLFPEPQYAMATVYIPDRRRMGSCRDREIKQKLKALSAQKTRTSEHSKPHS